MKKILFLLSLLITQQVTLFTMQQENQIIPATPSMQKVIRTLRSGDSQRIKNLQLDHFSDEQINQLKLERFNIPIQLNALDQHADAIFSGFQKMFAVAGVAKVALYPLREFAAKKLLQDLPSVVNKNLTNDELYLVNSCLLKLDAVNLLYNACNRIGTIALFTGGIGIAMKMYFKNRTHNIRQNLVWFDKNPRILLTLLTKAPYRLD